MFSFSQFIDPHMTFSVFITEGKADRPLRYETTRPISGKPRPITSTRERRNSVPSRRTSAPATFSKKELHSKDEPVDLRIETEFEDQSGHVTADSQEEEILTNEKPPMSVKVKKGHPMDKFMNDLRMIDEMEQNFKKSAIDLQKRLGIETDGFVYWTDCTCILLVLECHVKLYIFKARSITFLSLI